MTVFERVKRCESRWTAAQWAELCLAQINVPKKILVETYDEIVRECKQKDWKLKLQVCLSTANLIKVWVEDAQR